MGLRGNGAFAGRHEAADGTPFRVRYMGYKEASKYLNHDTPRGHANYRRTGWYWTLNIAEPPNVTNSTWYGRFTNSRGAYRDALRRLDAPRGSTALRAASRQPVTVP